MALPASSHNVLTAAVRLAATAPSPACILDQRGAYLFANESWVESDRGTLRVESLVGAAFLDHLEGADVRQAWREVLDDVLTGRATSRSITGEHNTAALARLTSTRVEPVASAHGGVLGLLLVRAVVRERPLSDLYVISDRTDGAYEDPAAGVTQCPCCRRVRDRLDPPGWAIVPRWIAVPPASVRWVTCDLCAGLHLGLAADAA